MPPVKRKRPISINGKKIAPGPISEKQRDAGLGSMAQGLLNLKPAKKTPLQIKIKNKRRRGI